MVPWLIENLQLMTFMPFHCHVCQSIKHVLFRNGSNRALCLYHNDTFYASEASK